MKKLYGILGAAALFTLASCSSNEPGDQGQVSGDLETNYLSVNIFSALEAGTRADDDGNYEDGTADENAISKVRFYFFNDKGEAAAVKADNTNYYDWSNPISGELEDGDSPNIEKVLTAQIVIHTAAFNGEGADSSVPTSIIAIINPDNASLPSGNASKQTLLEQTGSYLRTDNKNFVMANAVYSDEAATSPSKVVEVNIAGHIYTSPAAALNDPVIIFVERNVAKAVVTADNSLYDSTYNTLIKLKDKKGTDGKDLTLDGEQIYLKILGWNVTSNPTTSYLIKDIDVENWNDNYFDATIPWNNKSYKRSYWAINPSNLTYAFGDFGQAVPNEQLTDKQADTFKANAIQLGAATYMHENAETRGSEAAGTDPTTNATKVILAGQLVKSDGSALAMAQFGFNYIPLSSLTTSYASAATNLYKKTSEAGGSTKFTKVTADDLEIVTASSLNQDGKPDASKPGRYYVYVHLKSDKFSADTWYKGNSEESGAYASIDAVNKYLEDYLGHAMAWNNGYTYYFFDISHLNTKEGGVHGVKGVVRNHVYKSNITSIYGLGTPVYDPDEVIYPEKPTPENDSYVGAEIKVLSWRIVSNSVDLEW